MQQLKSIQDKIVSLDQLLKLVERWKIDGEKVVFTNGVFDLLHLGHIDYLSKTADCGTKLIIGLNADDSVKRLNKGPARPIKDETTRAHILASLQFVNAVVVFSDDTPFQLIQTILPAVLVKGGDYSPEETDTSSKAYIVGSDVVRKNGGEVKVIPFLPGHSTTLLEKKIIEANQ